MSLHEKLIGYLREHSKDTELLSKTDKQIIRILFQNYRTDRNTTKGLRLTKQGLSVFQSVFSWYSWEYKKFEVSPKHIMALDRHCIMPWYLDDKKCVLFETELGSMLALTADMEIFFSHLL